MGVGARRWLFASVSRGENSIRSDSDVSLDFDRHRSSRECLGDLSALLERAVVALEDLMGRLDDLALERVVAARQTLEF
ncbi:hypothetical protein [Natrinema sp. DC36]|uniref:hypothetical protein n=1 Tax=Natrinema sp. DC36 TaxID=2878680 RepID=UPI001CF015E6|nr:hypothetical protein [Natrinema sp. DC36]